MVVASSTRANWRGLPLFVEGTADVTLYLPVPAFLFEQVFLLSATSPSIFLTGCFFFWFLAPGPGQQASFGENPEVPAEGPV